MNDETLDMGNRPVETTEDVGSPLSKSGVESSSTPSAENASEHVSSAADGGSLPEATPPQPAEPETLYATDVPQVPDAPQVHENQPLHETPLPPAADDRPGEDEDLDDDDASDMEDEYDQFEGDVEPIEEESAASVSDEVEKRWYILKVQSNREKSICEGLRRRVGVAGLDKLFGEIIVPTEDVAEFKSGTRRVVKRKLYPGYIVVNMALNDDTWFLVRDTPGIGDFTGAAGKPTPMLQEEVDRIVKAAHTEEEDAESIKTAIPFKLGDRVRIKDGTFENFEGDVESVDEANGRMTVMINIFGRSTPVELEHWQVESV